MKLQLQITFLIILLVTTFFFDNCNKVTFFLVMITNFTITFIVTLHMIGHDMIGHKPLVD